MENKESAVHYIDKTCKVFIRQETMLPESNFHTMQHMHEEIEVMEVLDGCIYYTINGKEIQVKKGETIFVNSNCMHASFLKDSTHCTFLVLLIHPSTFENNPLVYETYVKPILSKHSSNYMIFHHHTGLASSMRIMLEAALTQSSAYQLTLIGEAYNVMRYIYEQMTQSTPHIHNQKDMQSLNCMTTFIYDNYASKLSLQDIAHCCDISPSTCTRLFNTYMNHTPIDFLNLYRLEIASHLLRDTKHSISEIALQCGFDQQSYFNRIFKKEYGCTPLQYRKNPNDQFVH